MLIIVVNIVPFCSEELYDIPWFLFLPIRRSIEMPDIHAAIHESFGKVLILVNLDNLYEFSTSCFIISKNINHKVSLTLKFGLEHPI